MADAPKDTRTADTGHSSCSSPTVEERKSKIGVNSNTNNSRCGNANDNRETRIDIKDKPPRPTKEELSLLPPNLRSIIDVEEEPVNNQSQEPKMHKVPDVLRSHKECYEPSMVFIGPYHRTNVRCLGNNEKLKHPMVRQFVKKSAHSVSVLHAAVEKIAPDIKKCYAAVDSSVGNLNDEEFTQMMFVDGCFVLQFIFCVMRDYNELKMSDQAVAFVRQDMLLLENQLPYEVLRTLMHPESEKEKDKDGKQAIEWEQIIREFVAIRRPLFALPLTISNVIHLTTSVVCVLIGFFCCCCLPSNCCETLLARHLRRILKRDMEDEKDDSDWTGKKGPIHLLERLYAQLVNKKTKDDNRDAPRDHGQYLYYSAKDLKKVGIYFRPSSSSALTNVRFRANCLSGTLTLPPITIDRSTKSMLLNLMALETCIYPPADHWVIAYTCFMDSLINDAEDVIELRSSGIIYNYLGTDQQVADLFNDMAKDLVPNPSNYADVKEGIDSQCRSNVKKWVAEFRHVYFRSPWTLIATLAAAFAIILTAIQTYLAAFPA